MTHTYPYMDEQVTWPPTISYPPSASDFIYGQTIVLYCGGRGSSDDLISGDWSLNGKSLNYRNHTYTAMATFEAQGDYECTGNPGRPSNVRVLGEFPPLFLISTHCRTQCCTHLTPHICTYVHLLRDSPPLWHSQPRRHLGACATSLVHGTISHRPPQLDLKSTRKLLEYNLVEAHCYGIGRVGNCWAIT